MEETEQQPKQTMPVYRIHFPPNVKSWLKTQRSTSLNIGEYQGYHFTIRYTPNLKWSNDQNAMITYAENDSMIRVNDMTSFIVIDSSHPASYTLVNFIERMVDEASGAN